MTRSAATLSDVAKLAGVDASTVSRVLNGSASQRVAPETRERILQSARTLGYTPNLLARSLRTARTHTIGIVIPLLDSPVFTQIIEGAEDALHDLGYTVVIAHIEENAPARATYEKLAHGNQVDGLLVSTIDENSVTVQAVKRAKVPFVIVNRKVPGVRSCVYFDMQAATMTAMRHLLELGHRRIAHLAAEPGKSSGSRLSAYQSALRAAGIAYDPALVEVSGYTIEGGASAMRVLLQRCGVRPTAVFPLTLHAAVGAMLELRRCGLEVPRDMSVVTLHDAAIAEVTSPALTTVRLPVRALGASAARCLVRLIGGGRMASSVSLAPEALVVRGSTAPPASAR